mmetsp:Transcript_1538/g.3711  ORF Transcript_1538/g.3711 Transcript_1538/m.3711 type:complete len:304 (-) Transcript_1538:123-1034(-)
MASERRASRWSGPGNRSRTAKTPTAARLPEANTTSSVLPTSRRGLLVHAKLQYLATHSSCRPLPSVSLQRKGVTRPTKTQVPAATAGARPITIPMVSNSAAYRSHVKNESSRAAAPQQPSSRLVQRRMPASRLSLTSGPSGSWCASACASACRSSMAARHTSKHTATAATAIISPSFLSSRQLACTFRSISCRPRRVRARRSRYTGLGSPAAGAAPLPPASGRSRLRTRTVRRTCCRSASLVLEPGPLLSMPPLPPLGTACPRLLPLPLPPAIPTATHRLSRRLGQPTPGLPVTLQLQLEWGA